MCVFQALTIMLSCAGLLSPMISSAQAPVALAGEPEVLVSEPGIDAMNPSWSPKMGDAKIAFTGANYRGLWVKSLSTGTMRQLSSERSAGFGYRWSRNGTAVVARVARYENNRRTDAVQVFSVDSVGAYLLSPFEGRIRALPEWSEGGEAVLLPGDRRYTRVASPMQKQKFAAEPTAGFVALDNRIVIVSPEGTEDTVVELENTVLNLSVSPDGTWLAFEVLGGDLMVARADGTRLLSLGTGNRPSWSPDSRWVVFMRTTDDGHVITSSDLMLGSTGGDVWPLTSTASVHEMNPSWSPDGGRIAYDHHGRIYALPVTQSSPSR